MLWFVKIGTCLLLYLLLLLMFCLHYSYYIYLEQKQNIKSADVLVSSNDGMLVHEPINAAEIHVFEDDELPHFIMSIFSVALYTFLYLWFAAL